MSSSCSWRSFQTSVSDSTLSLLHKSVVLCPSPWWRHMWSKSLSSLPFLYAAGRYHCLFARWSRSVPFVSHCVFCCLWRRHLGALCCTSAEDWVQDTLVHLCGGQQPQGLALVALTTSEQSSSHVCRILFAVSGNQRFFDVGRVDRKILNQQFLWLFYMVCILVIWISASQQFIWKLEVGRKSRGDCGIERKNVEQNFSLQDSWIQSVLFFSFFIIGNESQIPNSVSLYKSAVAVKAEWV